MHLMIQKAFWGTCCNFFEIRGFKSSQRQYDKLVLVLVIHLLSQKVRQRMFSIMFFFCLGWQWQRYYTPRHKNKPELTWISSHTHTCAKRWIADWLGASEPILVFGFIFSLYVFMLSSSPPPPPSSIKPTTKLLLLLIALLPFSAPLIASRLAGCCNSSLAHHDERTVQKQM